MTEFAALGLELAQEFNGDLSEQVVNFTYTDIETDTEYNYRGIPEQVEIKETDGESVYITTRKFFCLQHELPIKPEIDDTLTIESKIHHISRVIPTDNVVGWYIYANA